MTALTSWGILQCMHCNNAHIYNNINLPDDIVIIFEINLFENLNVLTMKKVGKDEIKIFSNFLKILSGAENWLGPRSGP